MMAKMVNDKDISYLSIVWYVLAAASGGQEEYIGAVALIVYDAHRVWE